MFYVFVTLNRGRSIALSAGCLFKYTTLNLWDQYQKLGRKN